MKSGSKRRLRAQRQRAKRVHREQSRANSRRRIAELVRLLTNGEVDPGKDLLDTILRLRPPELRIVADATLLSIPGHEAMLSEARRALDEYQLQLQPSGLPISTCEWFSIYFPITRVIRPDITANSRFRQAQAILEECLLDYESDNSTRGSETMPAPGTVLVRVYKGVEHKVTVLDDGFQYDGGHYRTLSELASLNSVLAVNYVSIETSRCMSDADPDP